MDEILIASVFKREPLWNPANELHKNAVVLKKLWEEVAVEVEKDVKTIKARWKNLRAYFFKECGKIDKPKSGDSADKICKSTWQYYDQLLFLKSKKTESESSARDSNLSTDNDENYSIVTDTTLDELQNPGTVQSSTSETITSDTQETQRYSQTSQRKKIRMNRTENNDQLLEIEKKKLEILQRESIKEKSDDLLFFESLLPYMENIPLRRKLRLRSKIQDLILTEIEAVGDNIQQSVPVMHIPDHNIQQSVPVMHIPDPNINTQQPVEYELHVQNSSEQNLIHPMQMENLISFIKNYK